jgi:hypothetical protein
MINVVSHCVSLFVTKPSLIIIVGYLFIGKAGGALTSNLLKVLYADEQVSNDDLSFVEVLEKVRGDLQRSGYEQIPQFSSLNPIDVNTKFDLFPDSSRGTKRAVMIGINYIGTSS